jgi:hypothetical protein
LNAPFFIIKVENGMATRVSGAVKPGFMNDCIEIVNRNKVISGFIYAQKSAYGKPVLKVSGEISGDIVQQLRNTWSFHS